MTKIYVYGKGSSQVSAYFEGTQTEDNGPYSVAVFTLNFDSAIGSLAVDPPFKIDANLVRDDGPSKRLATWKEAVEQANGEAKRLSAIALNKLHDLFRGLRLKADGTTQDGIAAEFLGITGVADAATSFDLEINPAGLLAETNSDEPVFRARTMAVFSAGFTSPFTSGGLDAVVHIVVQLTRSDVLEALPRIEVPALPHLTFEFPRVPLPQWSLHGLKIPFPKLPLIRTPLYLDLDLAVEWMPEPALDFAVAGGKLTLSSTKSMVMVKFAGSEILTATDVEFTVTGGKVSINAANIATGTSQQTVAKIDLKDKLPGPFVVTLFGVTVSAVASWSQAAGLKLVATISVDRLVISARTDPNLVLAVSPELKLSFAGDKLTPELTKLDLVEPYPFKLALFAAHVIEEETRRLLSLIHRFEVPKPDWPGTPDLPSLDGFLKVLRRIGELAASAAAWLAQQGAAGVRALAGLAEAAFKLIAELISKLAEAVAKEAQKVAKYIIVEVRVNLGQWRIVQIVVTPSDPDISVSSFTREFLGFKLDFPYSLAPALVCDLERGWLALALQPAGVGKVTLSTDLWLGHENGPAEPVSGTPQDASQAGSPLMELEVTPKDSKAAIALIVVDNGRVKFLQQLKTEPISAQIPGQGPKGGVVVPIGHLLLAARWVGFANLDSSAFDIKPTVNKDRILSLFRKPNATPGANPLDQFSQHIRIKASNTPVINLPTIRIPIDVEVKISDTAVDTKLDLTIDVYKLSMAVNGGKFAIKIGKNKIDLLGLKGKFLQKNGSEPPNQPTDFAPLFLDFSDGDPRLGLSDAATIKLSYDKLSTSGSTLDFEVDSFIVSRDGIDLSAQVQSNPVTLAGVDMPFRFDKGQLAVKRSQIQTFGLAGHGNLPPALVGEAKASIELNFTQEGGALALQAAKAVLDKSADPLRCEGTQFTITVTKLGLKYVRQGQYHFYFTLTGSAEFRPSSNAFADGLLKNLSSLRITLDEAPLASDPRVLMNHIEFQVTVEPPKRSTFFDLFSFELRGVGFHPASPAFGGTPAFSISGQVNFTDFGDIVTPRFDFHKLWVAPPERGKALPRVRFDGLGVGLSLGSMAEASGTAIAVDGKLPTLFQPDVLPANVTAKGFLASGSLRIQGWASMSASMGFLQLEKEGVDEKRPAFFLYVQRNDMAEKIPTPIGTIYLREVGFGFGYRYTLAGIAAAERAETPKELVKILDEISKYQGSLYDVKAWWPTYDNAAITLALRGMFSFTSVSTTSKYNEQGEKNLPNLALFEIVVALRTDLTFLMNLRIWIAYNYADWRDGRRNNSAWTNNPSLTGYMYLSVPRREFLARAVYNPGADIGEHPKLPSELKMAMKAVKWSSTLYIRPGLFHAEYGWPYELGFSVGKPDGNFFLSVEGGTVLRIEDLSVLYGLAFRARGFAAFAYDTGGDFGAAITARANFALGAKLIAYLSANTSDSMFYGVITLDLSLEFSVRMWLRTKWFSLSCGFSRSITIHIGVELLIQPGGLAARIEATVNVSAFGRNLPLGIGFSLGSSGRLAEARVRVERFLALGLATSYPNPEAGAPVSRSAPLPEPSRADNARKAETRLEEEVDRREATSSNEKPVQGSDTLEFVGVEFGPVSYWALLLPIPQSDGAGPESYVVQLIPRDNCPLAKGEANDRSHFYAAPMEKEDEATYVVQGVAKKDALLRNGMKCDEVGTALHVWTDWDAPFGRDGDSSGFSAEDSKNARQNAKLKEIFQHCCFMAKGKIGNVEYEVTDIKSVEWEKEPFLLPEDPEAANIMLAAAARSRADCGPRFKRMQQVDEARSSFIATVAEAAVQIAALITFQASTPELNKDAEDYIASKLEFDPRALGLTFVMRGDRIEDLFGTKKQSSDSPITSETFTIKTRIPGQGPSIDPLPPGVVLFNPPDRMFRTMSPVLDQPELEITTKGVRATWDLEPAWKKSPSLYGDPEFHLKHYRVERRIEGLADNPMLKQRPAPMEMTIKCSDHTAIVVLKDNDGNPKRDADGNLQLRKRRLREAKPLQFVDDFKDIDPGLRAALLPPVLLNNGDETKQAAKWKDVVDPDTTRIIYAIVPVDCAGTSGQVDTHVVKFEPRKEIPNNLLKAIARFSYPSMPSVLKTPVLSSTFLALTVEEEEAPTEASKTDENSKPELSPAQNYVLRVRTERTVAVGVFGADAVSQARNEPPVPDRLDPGAHELDVVLQTGAGAGKKIRVNRIARRLRARTTPGPLPEPATETIDYRISDGDWKKLLARLEVVADDPANVARLQAARIYLRFDGNEPRSPAWVPAQLQLMIDDPQAKLEGKEPPVNVTIERFEHPVDVKFRPFKSNYIFPASGRLHLYYPTADATIDSFVASNADTVRLLCDGDQRTAVKLGWTARPDEMTAQGDDQGKLKASDLHTLIAGYDLFSLDATTVPNNDEGADASLRLVKPIGRVQRLPALERGQEPSETGDFARVEVLYPSEMQRLTDPALDRRFGKRRTSWYSPAESFLVWPTRPLRRSLLTLPEENDIASLFARRQPAAIRVEWIKGKPDEPQLPPNTLGFASEELGKGPTALHDAKLSAGCLKDGDDSKPLTVDQARRLLRGLVLMGELADSDRKAYANPDKFSNRTLKLTSVYADPDDNSEPSTVTVSVSLAPPQHPILADVLDVVQYHYEGIEYRGKQLVYRRYEPVVDPAPQLNAEEILAFLDETAPDRDPAGWGVLRTLGLATAFRLYDIETGNFLESGEALNRLNVALKLVLPRYQGTQFGAPFVDVMFTTDGLSEVVSHFGTAPRYDDAAKQLCENKALALVQLELRPAVQPLLGQLNKSRVCYATLKLSQSSASVDLQLAKTGKRIVVEIEPLVPTDGSGQRRVLMAQGWKDEKQFPVDGEPISNKLTLKTLGKMVSTNGKDGDVLAYIRLVALDDDTDLSDLSSLTLSNGLRLDPSDTPKEDDGTETGGSPWGRLTNLPDNWLAILMFGDNMDMKVDPKAPDPERSAPFNTLATLIRILGRFPNKPNMAIPDEPKKRLQIAARLGPWTRRFMEQGLAKQATSQAAGLAFAMLTRPNPWRLAPDSDGRLSITLLEADRWGKARKYAIRPFGRYEALAIAAESTAENGKSEANKPAKTAMAVQDFAASLPEPIEADAALRQFFADVSIERTEGLAAPVILATRRNDKADKGGVVRPGDSVQIVVSRHPEEILSDANIRVDAGLSMRHVAVGFWREFSVPQWAKLVQTNSGDPEFDLLEPFGPFKDSGRDYSRLPVPKDLSIIKPKSYKEPGHVPVPYDYKDLGPELVDIDVIREMYERHPDLWRGAYVFNMSAMPYGFRLHATAHVAAGVVVSPPSVATVDEAGYRLVLPWTVGTDGATAWQEQKVKPAPFWQIDRPTSDSDLVKVVIEWPLVRIVDGMFKETKDIWFANDAAPGLYRMPDPAVSYRIAVETDDGQVRVGEVELGALSSDPDNKSGRSALYLTQLIGPRFVDPDLKAPSGKAVDYTHYSATLTLKVKGDPGASKPLGKFAPAALDPTFAPADLLLDAKDTNPWGDVAPGTSNEDIDDTLDLTITPPFNVPDPLPPPPTPPPAPQWAAFRRDVEAFVKEMRLYETTAYASPRFAKIAKEIADAVEPFAIDRAAEWKAKTGGLLPHTVKVHWVAGLPVEKFPSITLGRIFWRWFAAPEKTGTINGATRAKIKAVLDAAIAAAIGNTARVKLLEELRRTVLNAMRARMIALRRNSDEQPKHDLVPLRSNELPAGINLDELRKLSETSPIDFVATVHLSENVARTADEIETVLTALEDKVNTADTLESLAAMMERPGEAADIAMRWSSRKVVEPELNKLHPDKPPDPKTMILVKPAKKDEIAELKPAHAALTVLAGNLTQTMVLGPRRHLVIQAFHGLAQPQDDVVQREQ